MTGKGSIFWDRRDPGYTIFESSANLPLTLDRRGRTKYGHKFRKNFF